MAYALVQHLFSGATSASPTVTLGAAPTQGNLIVCSLMTKSSTSHTPPAGFTVRAQVDLGAVNGHLYIADKIAGASESATITWGAGTGVAWEMETYEFSGNAIASEFDVGHNSGEIVASSSQPGSITPTVANDLIITAAWNNSDNGGGENISVGTGYTILDAVSAVISIHAYKIKTDATAENITIAWTNSVRSVSTIASFKPFVPSPGGGQTLVAFRR